MNRENQPKSLESLFHTIQQAGIDSLKALKELSSIAGGGNQEARDFIHQIEQATDGELSLPWPKNDGEIVNKKPPKTKINKNRMMPPEHQFY